MQLITGRARDLGDGFAVRRVLPHDGGKFIGPWIFLDEMGPATYPPGRGFDVRPHPHIGLSTVTYLFEGEMLHRDSLGFVQAIEPGAVNWMTAGRGIVHSERTSPEKRASGQRIHGIQTWVALPDADLECEPGFVHHPASSLPRFEHGGMQLCLIAGEAFGHRSPVDVRSPMFYVHIEAPAGGTLTLDTPYAARGLYVVHGDVSIDGEAVAPGTIAQLEPDTAPTLQAASGSRMMWLGGEPVGKRLIWWNFVARDAARLEQAKADWTAQRFDTVPGESEFIPLPG